MKRLDYNGDGKVYQTELGRGLKDEDVYLDCKTRVVHAGKPASPNFAFNCFPTFTVLEYAKCDANCLPIAQYDLIGPLDRNFDRKIDQIEFRSGLANGSIFFFDGKLAKAGKWEEVEVQNWGLSYTWVPTDPKYAPWPQWDRRGASPPPGYGVDFGDLR